MRFYTVKKDGYFSNILGIVKYVSLLFLIFSVTFCQPLNDNDSLFVLIPSKESGLEFINQIEINDEFNVVDFDYIYNGGGLAVGDFNNDGLPDVFFIGNMNSSKLFLNQGGLKFTDVSDESNIRTDTWAEGVTLVDINNDGLLDIYVCVSNRKEPYQNPNLLFVNQGMGEDGVPVFEEMAASYGLDAMGYHTQAVFFDYDRDGYLDVYILSNALEEFQRNTSRPRELTGRGKSNDKLFKNNGDGTFSEVTNEAGILIEGYGLGISVSDFNQDGWPDIYVANDFITNDILYVNNGDGTFTNRIDEMLSHQSFNAMGVDVADFNNDGLVDIVVMDMFPPDNLRQKTMFASTGNYDLFMSNLEKGYEPQYVRNTLQLNRGNGTFSEIGHMAGIFQTDWSWAPLFADFDNDGFRDLFVSNGYGKDVTDLDYLNFTQNLGPFSTVEDRRALLLEGIDNLKEVTLPNYIFKNQRDLTFSDESSNWGIVHEAISNGAVYADFDNDGDLDILTNNLNKNPFLYQNTLRDKNLDQHNFLKVSLKGSDKNTIGIGAVLKLYYQEAGQAHYIFYEHYPTRGYKSFVEPKAHFGLGGAERVDSLRVIWPDGNSQIFESIEANQEIVVSHMESTEWQPFSKEDTPALFEDVTENLGIDYVHQHRPYKDFNRQILLPHKHSENGPGIAVGDVNGDGLDDFFVGGSVGSSRGLFIQTKDGNFSKTSVFSDNPSDDMGCLFLDIDGDGDLDLYVVSGGSRYSEAHPNYQDRIYTNDGKGNFELKENVLPDMAFSGSLVTAADFDGDGQLDLFVGGRLRPGIYPYPSRSAILQNKDGKFEDVTQDVCPECMELGMVTDALWTDFDSDGLIDLIVVGEWMPVTFLKQVRDSKGSVSFENMTEAIGLENSKGWWNSILPVPDKEGRQSYVLGNFGKNIRWKASEDRPALMLAKDFDGNQSVDPVMFHYLQDGMYPVAGRDALVGQVPSWKNRFLKYSEFAKVKKEDFFAESDLENSLELKVHQFASSILSPRNEGFELTPLPNEIQIFPVFGTAFSEGKLLSIGNFYGNETITGRYDAGKGEVLMLSDNKKAFNLLDDPGFLVDGEGRALAILTLADGSQVFLVSQHQGALKAFKRQSANIPSKTIKLEKDDYLVSFYHNGNLIKTEQHTYGQGYLSQSTRQIVIDDSFDELVITDFRGNKRSIKTGGK